MDKPFVNHTKSYSLLIKFIFLWNLLWLYHITEAKSYANAIRKNRFINDVTIGIDGSLYQLKFLNVLNDQGQKFLESGVRFNIGKYYANGLKIEANFMKGLNGIGPLFNNAESSTSYIRIYNTKLFLLNGQYDLYADANTFVSFKLGFGRLAYSQRYDGIVFEKIKENKITDVIAIASKFNYSLSRTLVSHVEASYIFGKEHLKFPMLSIGINYHITSYNFKKFKRNCPTFF